MNQHPDMLQLRTIDDAYKFAQRDTFRVGTRTFVRDGDDAYTDGKIVVFHEQQDSTSWAARPVAGGACTRYFWTPEYAVDQLLQTAQAVL